MHANRKGLTAAVIVLALAGAAVAAKPVGKPETERKTDLGVVVEGSNRFALDLYGELASGEGNLFFSPHSISTALAMTYAGARNETASQMAKTLRFDLPADRLHSAFGKAIKDLNEAGQKGEYELSVANALWGQKGYGFLPAFLELTNAHYGAGLHEVDFVTAADEARKTINVWVEKGTKEKIKDLIKPGVLGPMTRLVLTNAIYFKGNWIEPFDKKNTRDEPFKLADGQNVDVPMMRQTRDFKYAEEESFQMIELPYAGERLAMTIFLPGKVDGLAEFEKKLTPKGLGQWLPKLRKREVAVTLPKFKMTREFELGKLLAKMGMGLAFSDNADFSGMNGKRDLFISEVIHKAFVDVNEEGTEAAAATAVVMKMTAIAQPPPVFCADHPFIFLIRDLKTGSILFVGRVMNPRG